MGRRLVGGALVALGLMAASLAWSGFSFTRTVLDPSRSQALADDLYNDPVVRSELKSSIARGFTAALPDELHVRRTEVAVAAGRALDDPAVEQLVIGGLVRSHQRFLGADPAPDEPIVIDSGALAAATRSHLVNAHPELVGTLPEIPAFSVPLPTDSIPDASGLRSKLVAGVSVLAALAVGLVVAAFIVTNDRPRVLRRVGFWAIGAAAFWLIMGTVLPVLAHLVLPSHSAVIGGILGVAAGGMRQPSLVAAGAGLAGLVLSFVWGWVAPARRPVRSPARPTRSPAAPPGPPPTPVMYPPRPGVAAYTDHPAVTPAPASPPAPAPAPAPVSAPRWVEGVGYVDEP